MRYTSGKSGILLSTCDHHTSLESREIWDSEIFSDYSARFTLAEYTYISTVNLHKKNKPFLHLHLLFEPLSIYLGYLFY